MNYYLGIDIGTSGTKAVCFNKFGEVCAESTFEYQIYTPKALYAEENPLDWYIGCKEVIKNITSQGYNIKGIGLSGQMHGLVILDAEDNILRNSIIWCDNRAVEEAIELEKNLGNDLIKKITGNKVIPAFTLSKLLWVKNNEPEIYKKIAKIMLPKDYVRYMLTKEFKTEYSDASGMQLVDIYNKCYSKEILNYLEITEDKLPKLIESVDISGYIAKNLSEELGLNSDCFIVGGAGDQAAAAIGNGIIKKGDVSIVLGSSGVVFSPILKEDLKSNELQVFMHAIKDTYHIMGVTNGCGLSYKWFKENLSDELGYGTLNNLASNSQPLPNGLIYLPYLNGERTPYLDPYASGTFIGIRQNTTKGDMVRAILEGVGFSLKDCFSLLPQANYRIKASGGGAKGDLWREIIASIIGKPIERIKQSEGGALGVAILAMVAGKEYESIEEATGSIIESLDVVKPNIKWQNRYLVGYDIYKSAYLSLKEYYENTYKKLEKE